MELLEYLATLPNFKEWYANLSARQLVLGMNNSLKTLALENLLRKVPNQLVVYVANDAQARKLADEWQEISAFPIHLFPVNDIFSAEMAVASKDNMAARITALEFLKTKEKGAVILTAASASRYLPTKRVWEEYHLEFNFSKTYDFEVIRKKLLLMGYENVVQVEKPGDYSVRGSIIDIYPLNLEFPVRIDFFGDEIDSIRSFDFTTQKSLNNLDEVLIVPATDNLKTKEQYERASELLSQDIDNCQATDRKEIKAFLERQKEAWDNLDATQNDFIYWSYFTELPVTIADYFAEDAYYVIDDLSRIDESIQTLQKDIAEWQLQKITENEIVREVYINYDLHKELLSKKQATFLSVLQKGMGRLKFEQIVHVPYQTMGQFFGQLPLLKTECERYLKQKYTVLMLVSSEEKEQKLAEIMADLELSPVMTSIEQLEIEKLQIVNFPLNYGFELPEQKLAVITEKELFNTVKNKSKRRHRQNLTNAERLKSYNELEVGDYVVHVNHGIGKYIGMETIAVDGNHQDYITILYKNDDKLFIPVTQLNLIQKYLSQDGTTPKINKLGGQEWHKTKQKAYKKIEDIADELLQLYAKRELEKGFAFSKDNEYQQMFEDAFPYVETEDQLRSSKEIKADMEKERPMDRLLVGDVGYGKTEVAMRAVFKAVQDQKQVAFLVPTTILAQQHYETMKKRFADFPVNIAVLNRFKTKKEQTELLADLADGKIDVVIGTHRLLSKDIVFKDLGLLIIDEEQRFGVKHKERLKQLRSQVDVLTLTATPIPRTLHMSMVGVRDLSVIETPPQDRFPVQTYVLERHNGAIRDAIERELARGGQVFYLLNRVDRMESKVRELEELVPNARITYAHGQMTEHELESILLAFLDGEYDVLVTTTIVETGIDIPNVNTLFVDHADKMGLSQLYQLRGRVGRSNRIAYAYFMYEPMQVLTEVGEQRLEAIKEFTALGSGFKIAMRDLSIRGAGNLLGAEQHGFMNAIGFDLYSQMLEEAIKKKRGEESTSEEEVEINLQIDAYLPSDYLTEERLKIEIYKRLRELKTLDELDDFEEELLDRFGDYPDEVSYLLLIIRIKIIAKLAGIKQIDQKNQQVIIIFTEESSKEYKPENYMNALQKTKLKVRFNPSEKEMRLMFLLKETTVYWLNELLAFVKALTEEKAS